ncbi:putative nuclease HARBI1 [Photinus pyralis]|nr:putative nuclease HARBI1 [Photinus pyralis]
MDDLSFFKRFRLTKPTVMEVLIQIENNLEFPYDTNNSISPMQQLLIALRYYATGNHLLSIADFAGVHVSSVSRIVKKVSVAIASLRARYIKLPFTAEGLLELQQQFYEVARFPRVIGAVDGTHIRIQSPGGDDAEVFRNRKSYHSINVQGVTDARLNFVDIVVRWPGSAHDTTIFNSSRLKARFENGSYPNCLLLGDSGYPVKSYLLTPLLHPNGQQEQLYNESHIRTRGVVEKLFGVWKRRFPVNAYGCRLKLDTTLIVIVATAILHNVAQEMGEDEIPPVEGNPHELNVLIEEGNIPVVPADINHVGGNNVRLNFINDYFGRL